MNYLAIRYDAIYAKTAYIHSANASLAAVDARESRLATSRSVLDVILSSVDRKLHVVEKWFVEARRVWQDADGSVLRR